MKKGNSLNLILYKTQVAFLIASALFSSYYKKNDSSKRITLSECEYMNVTIYDQRENKDPNICLLNSYKIKDIKDMKEIIGEIIEFNNNDNVYGWNRTKESMLNEWIIHNILYDLGIQRDRTADVDFDNSDEYVYKLIK